MHSTTFIPQAYQSSRPKARWAIVETLVIYLIQIYLQQDFLNEVSWTINPVKIILLV